MKIRSKPKVPVHGTREYTVSIYGETLDMVLTSCRQYAIHAGYTPEEAKNLIQYTNVEVDKEWDYDYEALVAKFTIPTSDKEHSDNQVRHQRLLKSYNKWYEESKDKIEAELEARALAKEASEAERVQAQIDKLGKQLARNQQKLKAMGL